MSITILVVDDSKAALFMHEKIIHLTGIEIGQLLKAGNGREALAILEQHPECDLILTDLNMPEMDGLELIKAVKQRAVWRHIPMVVITTEGRDAVIEEALSCGAVASLPKPFRPEWVKEVILKTLGVKEDDTCIDELGEGDF